MIDRTHVRSGSLSLSAPTVILALSAAYLTIGLAALILWYATGDTRWVERFFRVPGAIVLIWLAVVQLWQSVRVWNWFSAREPMYWTWLLIACSSLMELTGAVLVQALGFSPSMRSLGHFFGGTLRFSLLAAGMGSAVVVYRRAGFLCRLIWWQWLLVVAVGVYVAIEAAAVVAAIRAGKNPGAWEILGWPVDPLLVVLLAQAFLLRNSVGCMGDGWIGRSWIAASIGIFLVLLGNIGSMAEAYGYLPWPWSSVTWYIWIPASCAFALAPSYQLDTIHRATASARA